MYSIATKADTSRSTMGGVHKLAQMASQVFANVLIMGESGVGKEFLAREIHRFRDPGERGFRVYPCYSSEIDLGEIRQLLFVDPASVIGQVPITLFLKSVEGISDKAQLQLLEVLEEEKMTGLLERASGVRKPRLMCSLERDFGEEGGGDGIYPSLAYHLDVIHIEVPPLRKRKAEILFLANLFLQEFKAKYKKKLSGFSLAVRSELIDYAWPGNVRELRNTVEEAVILAQGNIVKEVFLP